MFGLSSIGDTEVSMTFHDLCEQIESDEFYTRLAIASDANLFIKFVEEQPEFEQLVSRLGQHERDQVALAIRVVELLRRPFETRYSRLDDTALAVYIWALHVVSSTYSRDIADALIDAENLWWASRAARRAHHEEIAHSKVGEQTIAPGIRPALLLP
jgi:hypothetical protein